MKLIKILDKEEIDRAQTQLSKLNDFYSLLPEKFCFKTLGAATYIHFADERDALNNSYLTPDEESGAYSRIKKRINPILETNFRWIYDKIIKVIEEEYGEKCIISDEANLAFPGFHNFHAYEGCEIVSHPPHIDMQWSYHLDDLMKIFKEVDCENFLTFTLSIKLPKAGTGLYYWDLPKDRNNILIDSAEAHYREVLALAFSLISEDKPGLRMDEYEKIVKPNKFIYKEGYMTLFNGFLLHQIMPYFEPYSLDEERITLQGHGIKCDDIWRLYF